ncbi:MAG: thiamine pyrophosphate-dependent dehydrogenase E1 component subunit alpha [Thermoplasmata archaeon]|nr:thiamine pyrophosphate-dependent dehydrogenase E1 component subunit alpha [Thermoplasmata archaeon]
MVDPGTLTIAPTAGFSPAFPEDGLLDAYRLMVLARATDERCLSLQRQGRIGFYAPLMGQEAAQVGASRALSPEDWIFPAYRELAVALARGVSLRAIFDQLLGNADDLIKGRQMPNHFGFREVNFVVASSPIGTQITQAVGAAMAAQRRKDSLVTISFFGDGATSSNDFHAGLNFAGVYQCPTIFFCQNNQWAISLPRERQTHSATLAEKANAYGIPGVVVDGNDLNAVYGAVSEARARAISGKGPTMIEAEVYRFGPHSTSDDPKRYRTDAEVSEARERDPIGRLKELLITKGLWSEESDGKQWEEVRALVARTFESAEKANPLDPRSIFDDVFAQLSPRLEEERAEYDALVREGVMKP